VTAQGVFESWILGGVALVAGLYGLRLLWAEWRGENRPDIHRAPDWWPFDLPLWRALVRSGPIGAVEAPLTGGIVIASGVLDVVLSVLAAGSFVLMLRVALFNRPRFLVARGLRGLPGLIDERKVRGGPRLKGAQRNLIRGSYAAFNARDLDTALASLDPDVDWPNAIDGGRVRGHRQVRAYWTRQFETIDPHVEPQEFSEDDQGRIVVDVHQVVRALDGAVIAEERVQHVYTIRAGLIARMDIRQAPDRQMTGQLPAVAGEHNDPAETAAIDH
jgi:hypothetical protein